jgi:multidrug efflux pump subunit AcrA (membrane-fusion protein)
MQLNFKIGAESLSPMGEVAYVAPTADPASGLVEVRLVFVNPNERIPAGVDGLLTVPDEKAE